MPALSLLLLYVATAVVFYAATAVVFYAATAVVFPVVDFVWLGVVAAADMTWGAVLFSVVCAAVFRIGHPGSGTRASTSPGRPDKRR